MRLEVIDLIYILITATEVSITCQRERRECVCAYTWSGAVIPSLCCTTALGLQRITPPTQRHALQDRKQGWWCRLEPKTWQVTRSQVASAGVWGALHWVWTVQFSLVLLLQESQYYNQSYFMNQKGYVSVKGLAIKTQKSIILQFASNFLYSICSNILMFGESRQLQAERGVKCSCALLETGMS